MSNDRNQPSPSSGCRSTDDRTMVVLHDLSHSPSASSYSVVSTTTSPKSSSSLSSSSLISKSSSRRSTVKVAAKTIAGAFITCFTPVEGEIADSRPRPVMEQENLMIHCLAVLKGSSRDDGDKRQVPSTVAFPTSHNTTPETSDPGNIKFTMAEIYKATSNFSPSLKIGQGGFGIVYKGTLNDGSAVAIKRAKKVLYDQHSGTEFMSEVQTLAQVQHLNLVKCYGYIEEEDERILVVEYVPNGTLREHLDCMHGGHILNLAARLDIAIDVAHAITYLHMYTDHPIIHRDIKSSNILLTKNFRAKVADFGFARLAADRDSDATHVSTQVKGTAGYLDPEYLKTFQLTEKSDVYSFGVLLVELVTGRRPIETRRDKKERVTHRWVMKKFNDGDTTATIDPRLERNIANNLAVDKIFEVAFQCLAPHRQNRPSMKECAELLWTIRKNYKELLASLALHSFPSQRNRSVREE